MFHDIFQHEIENMEGFFTINILLRIINVQRIESSCDNVNFFLYLTQKLQTVNGFNLLDFDDFVTFTSAIDMSLLPILKSQAISS